MGKRCGNTECEEHDDKESCGCHLYGDYAYDCIDFIDGIESQNVGKPTLSEVLAEIDKKAFWDYIPRRSVPMKAVEEVLRKYFA